MMRRINPTLRAVWQFLSECCGLTDYLVFSAAFVFSVQALSVSIAYAEDRLAIGLNTQKGSYGELLKGLTNIGDQRVIATDKPSSVTMEGLLNGQLEWRKAIRSIKVEFDASVGVRNRKVSDATLSTSTFSMVYAEKGHKRFKSYTNTDPTSPPAKGQRTGPDFLYAYNGRHMKDIAMRARSGGIRASRSANFADLANLMFETVFYFVDEDRQEIERSTIHVPTALRAVNRYRVLPKLEIVDGYDCHVVSSGPDTLWIDPNHGFIVRRRVLFRQSSTTDPGILQALYAAQDFREFSSGVWLPTSTRRLDFGTHNLPKEQHGKLLAVNEFKANWMVNSVPDTQFEVSFPPGFLVVNHDNNTEFFAPSGEELLDEAMSNAGQIPGVISNNEGSRLFGRPPMLLVANVVAVFVLLLLVAVRWLRSGPTSRSPS